MKYILWIFIAAVVLISVSAFDTGCGNIVPGGEGEWESCWYVHSQLEFDRANECYTCHDAEPDAVYDFKPDLRIRVSDGQLVSVIAVNGYDCTLYTGEVVACNTVVRPPMMYPYPVPSYAKR